VWNARSGRVALLVPARSILADDGTRVTRFELLRPLKRSHITEDQLAESSWEDIAIDAFRNAWSTEVAEAQTSHKREHLYLATGLLLPVWDKLPSDFVRVSRISAADGRSLLGREVPVHSVPELCRALGLEREQTLSADDIIQTVLANGRAMELAGRESSWSNAAWSMAHSDLNSPDGVLLGSTGTRRKAALPRSSATRHGCSCRSKAQRA
jgi:hypothetical protein